MKLRDIRTLVNVEAPARSVADKLARTATVSTTPAGWRPNAFRRASSTTSKAVPRTKFHCGATGRVSTTGSSCRWGAIENLDLTSTVLGKPTALPLVLAPTGGSGFSTRTANAPLPVRRWQRAFRTDWRT